MKPPSNPSIERTAKKTTLFFCRSCQTLSALMSPELLRFFEQAKDLLLLESPSLDNINAINCEGENALHLAIHQNNIEIARQLIKSGINVNQPGDLGHTPLHEACSLGNLELIKLLLDAGADPFALTEGKPPFTLARFGGHDEVCNFLAVEMKKRQDQDPKIWIRARIQQLRMEIDRLERRLSQE